MLILSCKLLEITGQHKPCVHVCVDDEDDNDDDSMGQKALRSGTCAGSLRMRVCWSTFLRTAWTSFCSEPTPMPTSSSPTGSLSTWYVTSCHCVTLVTVVVWGIGFIVGVVMLLFLLLHFFSSAKRQQLYFNVLSSAHGYIRMTNSPCGGGGCYIYAYVKWNPPTPQPTRNHLS